MKLNFKKTGKGKPLIILHGLFGSADNWFSIAKELEDNYTLYLVDQRNHGDSPNSEDWNYQFMAEDLSELMSTEGIDSCFLMGHSMGGKTAMKFSLAHQDKIEKMIVADIAPRYYQPHHQTILEGLNAIPISSIKSRKEADDILSEHINHIGIRQFLLKGLGRDKEGHFFWKFNLPVISKKIENVGEKIDSNQSFDQLTLFMGGENSDYIRKEDKDDIERLFPNSHLIYIKDAGHWLHAEQPEAVIKTIKAFLK